MQQNSKKYDHLFKLLLIGDASVGKSSLLLRFTDDNFDDNLQSTIGVDFKVSWMEMNGKTIKITIWDTAGQERFRTLTSSYYRGAQGIILVYDIGRRDTFDNIAKWLEEVDTYCNGGRNTVKLLVGNKVDKKQRQVSKEEGEKFAKEQGMMFIEASAKTNFGVQTVFEEVINKILENPFLLSQTKQRKQRNTINQIADAGNDDDEQGCCF